MIGIGISLTKLRRVDPLQRYLVGGKSPSLVLDFTEAQYGADTLGSFFAYASPDGSMPSLILDFEREEYGSVAGVITPVEITAVIAPALGPLENGDAINSAFSADIDQTSNYASTAGTIASVVVTVSVDDSPAEAEDIVSVSDVVVLTVTVTDSESNVRVFTSSQVVTAGEIDPPDDGPTIEFAEWDAEAKNLVISISDDGDLIWSVTATAESDPEAIEAGTGASDFGSEAVTDGLNELQLSFPGTEGGTYFLNLVLKVGSDFSNVLSKEISIPEEPETLLVQAIANNNGEPLTEISATFDAAPTEGSILFAVIAASGTLNSVGVLNANAPSGTGWTLAAPLAETLPDARPFFSIWYKVAGPSEPSTVTFTDLTSRRYRMVLLEAGNSFGASVTEVLGGAPYTGDSLEASLGPSESAPQGALALAAVVSHEAAWPETLSGWEILISLNDTNTSRVAYILAAKLVSEAGALSLAVEKTTSSRWTGTIIAIDEDS